VCGLVPVAVVCPWRVLVNVFLVVLYKLAPSLTYVFFDLKVKRLLSVHVG